MMRTFCTAHRQHGKVFPSSLPARALPHFRRICHDLAACSRVPVGNSPARGLDPEHIARQFALANARQADPSSRKTPQKGTASCSISAGRFACLGLKLYQRSARSRKSREIAVRRHEALNARPTHRLPEEMARAVPADAGSATRRGILSQVRCGGCGAVPLVGDRGGTARKKKAGRSSDLQISAVTIGEIGTALFYEGTDS